MTGLKVIDGTPTAMSKYLREKEEKENEIKNLKERIKILENYDTNKLKIAREQGYQAGLNSLQNKSRKECYNQGMKDKEKEMLDDEINFIEEYLKRIRYARKNTAGLQIFQYPIQNRLDELKERRKELI